ncbi:aspartic-type endopeptidase [Rhodotorula toruloides]|uniref:Aspartic-type endopeptidase n=1 Tax=Rhodotorula toruloides TaxID=5286 RepID=A0A511KNR3_RHOTO|nr:aspartic-type endopeptidase [Rhodotorula toruloides]
MVPPPAHPLAVLLAASAALLSNLASAAAPPAPPALPGATAAPTTYFTPPSPSTNAQGGVHIPLLRRNGHLARRAASDDEQREILRGWAVREKGRLLGKYGTSEERLRKRAGDRQRSVRREEAVLDLDERDADDEGVESSRRRRRRVRTIEERQLGAPGGGALGSHTALSTAGVGGSSAGSPLSGSGSGSATQTSSTTHTAPTSLATSSNAPVGEVRLLNYDADLSYYAPVGIGVPAQYMNCILDTGSADLWVAAEELCSSSTGCPASVPLYNTSLSLTQKDMNTSFLVKYGSGSAQGEIVQDYVSFGGYNVSNQAFAVVDSVSRDLLGGDIGGLMGLGWQPLAASGVTPFWQNLYQAPALPFPGFGVSLTRFVNVTNASSIEPGGSLTFGYLNASLYSSEINYIPIPSGMESFWVVRLDQVAVNGTNVTSWELQEQSQGQNVAIDTGTTLIGGPKDVVQAIYGQVPGAKAATGAYSGYYSYPCRQNVTVGLTFGNVTYNMSIADFNLGPFGIDSTTNQSTCLGAFFDLSFGSNSRISWVIGAAFLKNVYSVFRASPPSVGFALPPNSTTIRYPSWPTNSSDPAHDGNLTAPPGGIYGPSGTVGGNGASTDSPRVRTTLVAANTVTTAVQAGGGMGRTSSGGIRRSLGQRGAVGGTAAALVVGVAIVAL